MLARLLRGLEGCRLSRFSVYVRVCVCVSVCMHIHVYIYIYIIVLYHIILYYIILQRRILLGIQAFGATLAASAGERVPPGGASDTTLHMCVYIYIYRERERDNYMCYVYIYIYMYRERERERSCINIVSLHYIMLCLVFQAKFPKRPARGSNRHHRRYKYYRYINTQDLCTKKHCNHPSVCLWQPTDLAEQAPRPFHAVGTRTMHDSESRVEKFRIYIYIYIYIYMYIYIYI